MAGNENEIGEGEGKRDILEIEGYCHNSQGETSSYQVREDKGERRKE